MFNKIINFERLKSILEVILDISQNFSIDGKKETPSPVNLVHYTRPHA